MMPRKGDVWSDNGNAEDASGSAEGGTGECKGEAGQPGGKAMGASRLKEAWRHGDRGADDAAEVVVG